ncbi:amino acid transporter [Rhizophagus irregularis]|uniref:Amino acid transporter n=1 Tax=Rhizophagus irregularis TaxID=588596 RepID=A0A2I1FV07_9GLOM|nr:amino acid transporter [Rhizophagus irregularis]
MSVINDDITTTNESRMDNEIRESIYAPSRMSVIESPQDKQNKILGVAYGIGLNINNVIGSEIVTTPGIIWNMVKSPGTVLLLWLIGGIVSMAGSLSYVELGVIHKISGGETKYLQTAYPKPKILMSYLFSFMHIFAIRPGIISAVLQSAAQYSWFTINGHRYDEGIKQDTTGWNLPFSPFWFTKILAVVYLLIITIYHMINNRWANYINQSLAVIKLITYSIIALAGIYRLASNWSVSRFNWEHPINGDTNISAYSSSILLIMFSYDGWNTLNYSLDEFRKPGKKLIFSNSISVGIVTLMYLLVNIAFISVVPQESISNNNNIDETIAATFFYKLFGKSVGIVRLFTALVVLSVIGTAAAGVWSGSRVIVAAAASDFFPKYSKELRTWNQYFNTPINALLLQFIWCSFIILFVGSSFTITSFTLFSTFSMYSYWIFYFATGIGLLLIRRNKKNELKKKQFDMNDKELNETSSLFSNLTREYKVPLPFAIIFILAGLFILVFSFVVNVECPKDKPNCDLREKTAQQLAPILISYGFLFVALTCWYTFYYWWGTIKDQREAAVMRIADENEKPYDFN